MTPLAGLFFRGRTLTENDDIEPGRGLVGRPVWNRSAMLADLELRSGLATPKEAHGVRLQQWSRKLAELATRKDGCFYSASYEADPVGTASALLAWRDSLVDAGWNGERIEGGGERLEMLAELEGGTELVAGAPERLRRVEQELAESGIRPWEALELAEPRAAWPGRWQRAFDLLDRRGTEVRARTTALPSASCESDLGRLQASLRGEAAGKGFDGDGSIVLLRGETSWELAYAVAAMVRYADAGRNVVVRGGDPRPLDAAFAAQGLARQGIQSKSVWRPALQLLPLAIELAYSPRDPYRVLELVTLPLGPFEGWVGRKLARALASAPGIGGRAWLDAKQAIAESTSTRAEGTEIAGGARLEQIAEWLERPGYDAARGAPRSALLEVSERVVSWLEGRYARAAMDAGESKERAHDPAMLGAALAQTRAFHDALSHEPRETLDLVASRQLLQEVSPGPTALALAGEEAGRIDVVDDPAGLRVSRDVVVWWHCVNGTQTRPPIDPWRRTERAALAAAGVAVRDTRTALAAEAAGWRGVVLAARRRLVLVVPSAAEGSRLDAHPIWDEIVARRNAEPGDVARVTLSAGALFAGQGVAAKLPPLRTRELSALALPEPRPVWNLDPKLLGMAARYTVTSVEDLVGCPLHWVFQHRAGLGGGWTESIPSGPLLYGRLGHRLLEELHGAGALAEPATAAEAARALLDRLLEQEAAVLLRPGMIFELTQLREQLARAVERLAKLLAESRLAIAGVETKSSVDWRGRTLEGRLDLLLRDAEGGEVVLDLKWGRSSYRDKLEQGLAVQLAVYAASRKLERGVDSFPAAGYFSLSKAELLTTEGSAFGAVRAVNGPRLENTWNKLERTVAALEAALARGSVPATGLRQSLPLLSSAGVPDDEQEQYLAPAPPCDYCKHSALCGRAWEEPA